MGGGAGVLASGGEGVFFFPLPPPCFHLPLDRLAIAVVYLFLFCLFFVIFSSGRALLWVGYRF